jgi:hypothetical protein
VPYKDFLVVFVLLCLLFVAVQVVASYVLSPAVLVGVQGLVGGAVLAQL